MKRSEFGWVAAVWGAVIACACGLGWAANGAAPGRPANGAGNGAASAPATPAVLMEKAIYTEETVGDLDAAIKLYKDVIAQAQETQKLAAQAQYRLAMCQLKKGDKPAAARELSALLAAYPQESAIVAQARQELAKLAPPGPRTIEFLPLNKVVERTVYDDASWRDLFIDLDTGVLGTPAKEQALQDIWSRGFDAGAVCWDSRLNLGTAIDNEFVQRSFWAVKANPAVAGGPISNGPGLYHDGTVVVALVNKFWETATIDNIRDNLTAGHSGPAVMEAAAPLPRTYAFKTRQGSIGVLQVLEFVNTPPRHIKIQYKLLEHGRQPAAGQPPNATPTARTVAEQFLAALKARNEKAAMDMTAPASAVAQQIKDLAKIMQEVPQPTVALAFGNDSVALIGTTYIPADKDRKGPLLIRLAKQRGLWVVDDIDLESAQSANKKVQDFLKQHPDAREIAAAGQPAQLPAEVMLYIIGEHTKALGAALAQKLPVNTHIYGVDDQFSLYSGGLISYRNGAKEPQAGPVHLTNFGPDKKDFLLTDEQGQPQEYEWRENADATSGKWGLWWKPAKPIPVGANRLLGYLDKQVRKLPRNEPPSSGPARDPNRPIQPGDSATLTMSNFYGPAVLESFFLVAPPNIKLINHPAFKDIATIGDFVVYLWRDKVPAKTKHEVAVTLSRAAEIDRTQALLAGTRRQAEDFIAALRKGDAEAAGKFISEEYRKVHPKGLELMAKGVEGKGKPFDFTETKLVQVLLAEEAACVVLAPVSVKDPKTGQARTMKMGLGLIRFGNTYLIRDVDALPDEQRVGQFVSGFKQANPKFTDGTRPAATQPSVSPENQAMLDAARRQAEGFMDELRAGELEAARKRTAERSFPEGLDKYVQEFDLSQAKPGGVLADDKDASMQFRPVQSKKDKGKKPFQLWVKLIRAGLQWRVIALEEMPEPTAADLAAMERMAANNLRALLMNWVEKFFSENYRDITGRKLIFWGAPERLPDGDVGIRYKYEATFRNNEKKVIEQRFTFTSVGKFVTAEMIESSSVGGPATRPAGKG